MDNLIQKNNVGVITLKDLTDLISVQHSKAMAKIGVLSLEPSFGTVSKIDIVYNEQGQTIETYLLTKKQAIAVGAKLNNSLLMKVIDTVEELEKNKNEDIKIPKNPLEAIALFLEVNKETDTRLTKLEDTKRLENWQEKALHDAKNIKVYEIANDDKLLVNKLHRKVWSLFKKHFHLARYNELPAIKFDEGKSFISNLTLADMVA